MLFVDTSSSVKTWLLRCVVGSFLVFVSLLGTHCSQPPAGVEAIEETASSESSASVDASSTAERSTPEAPGAVEVDDAGSSDTFVREQEAQPDTPASNSTVSFHATGKLQEVYSMLLLSDGAVAILVRADGAFKLGAQEEKPPAGRHMYLLVVNGDGSIRWSKRLLSSDNTPGGAFKMLQLGDSLAISFLGRKGTFDPDGQKVAIPDPSQKGVEWSHFVFQVNLQTGKAASSFVRVFAEITTLAGDEKRWFIGGVSQGELKATANGKSISRAPQKTESKTGFRGNAFVLELDGFNTVQQVWMLDGPASSSVGSLIPTKDGLYVAGGLGGYGNGLDGIFDYGLPTEKTLTSLSADDDPAWDIYVARLDTSLRLKWARLTLAYHNENTRAQHMVRWGDGVAFYASKSGYPLVISKGESDERKEQGEGIVAYDATGRVKGFFRVSGVRSLRESKDGLLVHGQTFRETVVGSGNLKIPAPQTLGADPNLSMFYVLQLGQELTLKEGHVGGWMQQGKTDVSRSWSYTHPISSKAIWFARTNRGAAQIEKGGKESKTFGEDDTSNLLLVRWPLRYPIGK